MTLQDILNSEIPENHPVLYMEEPTDEQLIWMELTEQD